MAIKHAVPVRCHHRVILSFSSVENADSQYRDPELPWLPANTAVRWGEKCVFYQAERSIKALRGCTGWMNNEPEKRTVNFSLCWDFRRWRQATGGQRGGRARLPVEHHPHISCWIPASVVSSMMSVIPLLAWFQSSRRSQYTRLSWTERSLSSNPR